MSESNETSVNTAEESNVSCHIEHHAVLFALLCKNAMHLCGDEGKQAILDGVAAYGRERGARMAANAKAHGDPLNTMTNQAYGEWKPESDQEMIFDQLQTEPTFQTVITKCAWCTAWEKHQLTEYGKYYCVNIDKAVYEGFHPDFVCTPQTTFLSFGGSRCVFDWGSPLSQEEISALKKKKAELGTSCMKDFTFHTAHLLHTLGNTLIEKLGENGTRTVELAKQEYTDKFGQEYLDVLAGAYPQNA